MMSLPLLGRKLEALGYRTFMHERGRLTLSAEETTNGEAYLPDYYAETDDGPFIPAAMRELATKANGYWEWVNPGELVFVRKS